MTRSSPTYVIGDIHGHIAKLDRALSLVEADGGADAPIIFLGDYVDRGPDSCGVIQRLIDGRNEGRPWQFLLGNHDRMFLRFVTNGEQHDDAILSGKGWLHPNLGGGATLASYMEVPDYLRSSRSGTATNKTQNLISAPETVVLDLQEAAREKIPFEHIAFLNALPLYLEDDRHLFVHAGIRPGVDLADQIEDDLIWIREPFLSDPEPFDRLIIHGHTALDKPTHYGPRIDFDGGAAYGKALVPGVFDGQDWHTLHEDGRTRLDPPES